jgi:hypothetical protein
MSGTLFHQNSPAPAKPKPPSRNQVGLLLFFMPFVVYIYFFYSASRSPSDNWGLGLYLIYIILASFIVWIASLIIVKDRKIKFNLAIIILVLLVIFSRALIELLYF